MIHDSSVVSLQTGIFRTNCIDCLDRTNVVQSLLAKKSLLDQFNVCLFVAAFSISTGLSVLSSSGGCL